MHRSVAAFYRRRGLDALPIDLLSAMLGRLRENVAAPTPTELGW